MKHKKKYFYDKDGDKLIEDIDVKPNWVEEDTMAEEQNKLPNNYIRGKINSKTPFNKQSKIKSPEIIKLELLRELTNYLIELGRTQPTKTMLLDWIDQQKNLINNTLNKSGGFSN